MNQRISAMTHLLNDSREGTTVAALAERFQVSQRTIRNEEFLPSG